MNDDILEQNAEQIGKEKKVKPENRNLTGIFHSHPKGFGFVSVEGEPEDIFIPSEYVNGAFYKDRVLVKVKGKQNTSGKRPEGMITKILERGCKTLTGTFERQESFGFVLVDDPCVSTDIFIKRKHFGGARHNDKVKIGILSYGTDKKKPEGEVLEVLGNIEDPMTDVRSVISAYGIEKDFSEEVRHYVKKLPGHVSKDHLKGRTDLREKLTVTIDNEDAKDLDDAVTVERLKDGYLLGVHIADVSSYVLEGTVLDQAALLRGTSVYFADRVIPMLPEELSNGICSLNQGTDRLTLSCIMRIDLKGNVVDHRIEETVICVDQRMSYDGVCAILKGEEHPEGNRRDICELCFLMEELAALLKEKRRKRGAIDFDFPEAKILLDEFGNVCDIFPYERNRATDIIEDFMLLANETVAEDYFWQEIPFLYRIHEAPAADKVKMLDLFIRNFGYYMKTGRESFHPKEIQKLLFSLEGKPEESLISRLALRSMQRARYSDFNAGHFGLSTQYYTHFTSPIRRYPDLQIHRIIKENLHGRLTDERIRHYEKILPGVARQCSELERRAVDAERDVEKLKKIEFISTKIGEHYSGVISGVISSGFFVELYNTIEGMVPVESLTDDFYHFDQEQYQLKGEKTGRIFTLGQPVDIVVASADKARKTIDFSLEEFSPDSLSYDEKTGIAVNDWMTDEEADRLLALYKNSSIH